MHQGLSLPTYPLISDEPEPEFSSSSRAELGHFNFRAETELDFFLISSSSKVFGTHKNTY